MRYRNLNAENDGRRLDELDGVETFEVEVRESGSLADVVVCRSVDVAVRDGMPR